MKKYFYILLFIYSLLGCKKSLDLSPQDRVSDANYWNAPDQFKANASSFYNYFPNFNPAQFTLNLGSDFYSDLSGTISSLSEGTYVAPAMHNAWTNSYAQLRNINNLLEKANGYHNQAEIKLYVAEAHFFRAYVYFRLLFYFGGVPLITKTLSTNAPELQLARATRDEVIKFILFELDAAIPDLPLEEGIPNSDKGRVSKGAALAFKGRVTLFEGTWQKFRGNETKANELLDLSIASSNLVIESGQYQLFSPENGIALGDSTYKYLFILENERSNPLGLTKAANREYILVNRFDYSLRPVAYNISHTSPGYPTQKLASMYLCTDGLPIEKSPLFKGYGTKTSEFVNRDLRFTNTFRIPGKRYWDYGANARYALDGSVTNHPGTEFVPSLNITTTGYVSNKFRTERAYQSSQEGFDFPVIRYAEVLLTYAEALFERNGTISDAELNKSLNIVRTSQRVKLPPLTNSFVTSKGLDMRTEIRRERTVELAFEGFRFFDLLRWKIAEVEMPKSLLGIKYKGTEYELTDPNWKNINTNGTLENGFYVAQPASSRKFDPNKNYLEPIPLQELNLNKNLIQNPGWE